MFSDSLMDAYHEIYKGIQSYEYCVHEREAVIQIMAQLNMLFYRYLTPLEHRISLPQQLARATDVANFDFDKALAGIDYGSGDEWNNHHLYDLPRAANKRA